VWLGGTVPAALERCGRLSDGWLPSLCTPDEAAAGRVVIEDAAARTGRSISGEHFGVSIGYAGAPIESRHARMMVARRPRALRADAGGLARLCESSSSSSSPWASPSFVLRPVVAPTVVAPPSSRPWPRRGRSPDLRRRRPCGGAGFRSGSKIAHGVIEKNTVTEVSGSPFDDHARTSTTFPLSEVKLLVPSFLPPSMPPGSTYREHVTEMASRRGVKPEFPRTPTSATAPTMPWWPADEPIVTPRTRRSRSSTKGSWWR